jgi:hypothetical protein
MNGFILALQDFVEGTLMTAAMVNGFDSSGCGGRSYS